MTRWTPDTCYCIIEFDPVTLNHTNTIQKCTVHSALDGQPLLDAINTHNHANNVFSFPTPTEAQIEADLIVRRALKETTRP